MKKFIGVLFAVMAMIASSAFAFTVNTSSTEMTGKFWNPAESGWGVDVVHQYGTIIATILTYDNSGNSIRYFASNCAVMNNGCTSDLYRVTGGVPLTATWNGSNLTQVNIGFINLIWSDIDYATMTGMLDGVQFSKPLTRMVFAVASSKDCTTSVSWTPGVSTCITPMGVKVSGANQLPVGCNTWKDQCWKDAVANGTVKFVATSATMPGTGSNSNRPIVFAYFRNTSTAFGVTGLWSLLPIYADDGSAVGTDISSGSAQEIDWVNGNAEGAIIHGKGDTNCIQSYYYPQGFTWSSKPVACPL